MENICANTMTRGNSFLIAFAEWSVDKWVDKWAIIGNMPTECKIKGGLISTERGFFLECVFMDEIQGKSQDSASCTWGREGGGSIWRRGFGIRITREKIEVEGRTIFIGCLQRCKSAMDAADFHVLLDCRMNGNDWNALLLSSQIKWFKNKNVTKCTWSCACVSVSDDWINQEHFWEKIP